MVLLRTWLPDGHSRNSAGCPLAGPEEVGTQPGHPQADRSLRLILAEARADDLRDTVAVFQEYNKEASALEEGIMFVGS